MSRDHKQLNAMNFRQFFIYTISQTFYTDLKWEKKMERGGGYVCVKLINKSMDFVKEKQANTAISTLWGTETQYLSFVDYIKSIW